VIARVDFFPPTKSARMRWLVLHASPSGLEHEHSDRDVRARVAPHHHPI
jgi:hypothetical protein